MKFPKAIAIAAATLGLSRAQQLALDSAFTAARDEEEGPSGEQDYPYTVRHLSAAYDAVGELLDGARKGVKSEDEALDLDDESRQRLSTYGRALDCIARGKAADVELEGTKRRPDEGGVHGNKPVKDGPSQEVARGDRRPRRASDSHLALDARFAGAGSPLSGCHDRYLGAAAHIVPGSTARVADLLRPTGGGSTEHSIADIFKPVLGDG